MLDPTSTSPTPATGKAATMSGESWTWTIAVSDWPIGRADYDLTADEALAALTGRKSPDLDPEAGQMAAEDRSER